MSEKTAGYSVTHKPLGTKQLWHTPVIQLPAYIQNIAAALQRDQGMDESRAIATAVGTVRRWAAGGGKVHPEVRAAAAKAIAEWEKVKAEARATPNKGKSVKTTRTQGKVIALAASEDGTVSYGSGPGKAERAKAQSKGQAFQSGRFPVRNVSDLKKAIQAFGRVKPEDKAALKRFIIRRARALGMSSLIPDSWTTTSLANLHSKVVELATYQRHVAHTKQFGRKKGDLSSAADWSHNYDPKTAAAQAVKAKRLSKSELTSSGALPPGKEGAAKNIPPSAKPGSTPKSATKPSSQKPETPAPKDAKAVQSTATLRARRNVLQQKATAGTLTPGEKTELNAIVKQIEKRARPAKSTGTQQ